MNVSFKESLPFIILATVCAIILAITHELSRDRIAENTEMEKLRVITAVMTTDFDNNIYKDSKIIHYTDDSGNRLSTHAYRARKSGRPVGVVFMPILAKGYNAPIQLSIGILTDGTIFAIQVLTHQETKGLGGNVHQDKSDWLKIFTGQSLELTAKGSWSIEDESGSFDQLSGATITSRGVINAIKNGLELYLAKQDTLFL